jgi:hypothetical protein
MQQNSSPSDPHSLTRVSISLHVLVNLSGRSQCSKNSSYIETICNKFFCLDILIHSLEFSLLLSLQSDSTATHQQLNANVHIPSINYLFYKYPLPPPFPHHRYLPSSAIRQALNGKACNLTAAGLIYPQNVTTPISTHTIFIT